MPRAAHFNGAQVLTNANLGQLPDFASRFNSQSLTGGICSYWYKAPIPTECTMLVAYSLRLTSHCLRVYHSKAGPEAIVQLQLQRAGSLAADRRTVSFVGGTPIPFDDKWHHVIMAWSTSFNQVGRGTFAQIAVDGTPMRVQTYFPPNTAPLAAGEGFAVDYSAADNWQVGGEVGANFLGDLAEVYLQITDFNTEIILPMLGMNFGFQAQLPMTGAHIQLFGTGFIDVGYFDKNTGAIITKDRFTAMEIGPDGADALGVEGLAPQIYLTVPAARGVTPLSFLRNVTGVAPRVFDVVGGVPPFAGSDPFPLG